MFLAGPAAHMFGSAERPGRGARRSGGAQECLLALCRVTRDRADPTCRANPTSMLRGFEAIGGVEARLDPFEIVLAVGARGLAEVVLPKGRCGRAHPAPDGSVGRLGGGDIAAEPGFAHRL